MKFLILRSCFNQGLTGGGWTLLMWKGLRSDRECGGPWWDELQLRWSSVLPLPRLCCLLAPCLSGLAPLALAVPWYILSDSASAVKFLKVELHCPGSPLTGPGKPLPSWGCGRKTGRGRERRQLEDPRSLCELSGGQASETQGPGARPVLSNH